MSTSAPQNSTWLPFCSNLGVGTTRKNTQPRPLDTNSMVRYVMRPRRKGKMHTVKMMRLTPAPTKMKPMSRVDMRRPPSDNWADAHSGINSSKQMSACKGWVSAVRRWAVPRRLHESAVKP